MTKPVEKTIEMPKVLGKKWLNALRSGKYKQAREKLIDSNGAMCCLGVLCHVAEGKVDKGTGFPSRNFYKRNNIKLYDCYGDVNKDMVNPLVGDSNAATLNDNYKLSFKQIAQRLEKRIKFI